MTPKPKAFVTQIGQILIWPLAHLSGVIGALDHFSKAEPGAAAAISALLAKIEQTALDATAAATADGLSVSEDIAAATAAAALYTYVTATFIPQMRAAFQSQKPAEQPPTPKPTPPKPTDTATAIAIATEASGHAAN